MTNYDELYRDASPQLWRALFVYAGGRRDVADDAVAEAFARLIPYDGQVKAPVPWLYKTAFRIAASELRRRSEPLEDSPVWDSQDTGELVRALRELSPSQRAAVYLHYQADLPVREVARLMGTSTAAVKVHLHRGRNRLAVLLADTQEAL